MVREWDPRIATAREITTLVATLNDCMAVDLPDDPPWRDALMREYLSVIMPGARKLSWIAEEHEGDITRGEPILGMASMLLLGDIGVVEIIVHPSARKQGLGRELLRTVVATAHAEGFTALGVEVPGKTDAVPFYESFGFVRAFTEIRSVLQLDKVDWFTLGEFASGVAAGYRLQFCPDAPPEDLIEAYASAKASVQDIDLGDLDLKPSSHEPDRLRASLATLHARGLRPYIVVAVHEPTGDVVGLTEVVVPAQHPSRADQYDTIVVPGHRGYGVGRAIKALMLFELRSHEPRLTEVQTWNAAINEPMIKVNQELGFIPDREWLEYEADVADLAARLGLR
ncbi:GNAT family N-acetyltransferase [Allocatelliglobosispora scoriae]|nr:GNAT family N-acetyltransferase [Allocatelliglobosispora scoriae]